MKAAARHRQGGGRLDSLYLVAEVRLLEHGGDRLGRVPHDQGGLVQLNLLHAHGSQLTHEVLQHDRWFWDVVALESACYRMMGRGRSRHRMISEPWEGINVRETTIIRKCLRVLLVISVQQSNCG